jgi:hypothetical protein
MDLPSRGSAVWQAFGRDLRRQATREYSSLCVRLRLRLASALLGSHLQSFVGQVGKLVSPLHSVVGVNRRPRDYYLVVREPRPTKVAVAGYLSLLTSHLSLQGYVCS